jgi:Na+-transporting methylmalonyl-CoA/oxaloacetate decarboxylase gamma subunit
MLVVFVGLILLFLIFNTIGNTASNLSKKRKERKSDQKNVEISTDSSITGDEIAAISAALHELMDDQHDVESSVLTIQQIQRNYSPWSFKAQTLRRNPRR